MATERTIQNCMADINRRLSGDPCCLPTAQTTVRNATAPLRDQDVRFWLGMGPRDFRQDVDLFADPDGHNNPDPNDPLNEGATTISSGLVDVGVRTKVPMLVDSICIVMRGEMDFASLDGNLFGDYTHALASLTAGVDMPSCRNPWSDLELFAGLHRYAAQLDINKCCLRAARYFMEAFQVAIGCPTSPNVHEIVRQRLIEIGNCCFGPRPDGFGDNLRGWLEDVRRFNQRMHLLCTRGLHVTPATAARINMELTGVTTQDMADPLYGPFRSWNVLEGRLAGVTTHYRTQEISMPESDGNIAVPGAAKWLRLRKPFVLDKDDNIDIKLSVDPSEEIFRMQGLQQLCYQPPISEIMLSNGPLTAQQLAAVLALSDGTYTSQVSALMARCPTGTLRFGVLLKGLMLDCNVCSQVKDIFHHMTLEEFDRTPCGMSRLSGAQIYAYNGGQDMGDVLGPKGGGCGCGL